MKVSAGVWAERYLRLGWRVLPLAFRSKSPLGGGNGVHDASADPEAVRRWFDEDPDRNLAIALGDGLAVLDADRRKGADVEGLVLRFATAPIVLTKDGAHVYVREPEELYRRATALAGVELRGREAYVVAPPSVHPSGVRYRWARPPRRGRKLVEVPAELLRRPPVRPAQYAVRTGPASPYGRAALDGLEAAVRNAIPSERHPTLYRCAARAGDLVRQGHLDGGLAFDRLAAAGLDACGPGRENEVVRTVRDAMLHPSGGAA